MFNRLTRLVAVILVFCLIANPAMASIDPSNPFTFQAGLPLQFLYTSQALALPAGRAETVFQVDMMRQESILPVSNPPAAPPEPNRNLNPKELKNLISEIRQAEREGILPAYIANQIKMDRSTFRHIANEDWGTRLTTAQNIRKAIAFLRQNPVKAHRLSNRELKVFRARLKKVKGKKINMPAIARRMNWDARELYDVLNEKRGISPERKAQVVEAIAALETEGIPPRDRNPENRVLLNEAEFDDLLLVLRDATLMARFSNNRIAIAAGIGEAVISRILNRDKNKIEKNRGRTTVGTRNAIYKGLRILSFTHRLLEGALGAGEKPAAPAARAELEAA